MGLPCSNGKWSRPFSMHLKTTEGIKNPPNTIPTRSIQKTLRDSKQVVRWNLKPCDKHGGEHETPSETERKKLDDKMEHFLRAWSFPERTSLNGSTKNINVPSREYCNEWRKDRVVTAMTTKTPAPHAASTPILRQSVLARARNLTGTE
jgi:hypothetical protein